MALLKEITLFNDNVASYHRISDLGKTNSGNVGVVIRNYPTQSSREKEQLYNDYLRDTNDIYKELNEIQIKINQGEATEEDLKRFDELQELLKNIQNYAQNRWGFYIYEMNIEIPTSELENEFSYDAVYEYLKNDKDGIFYGAESV